MRSGCATCSPEKAALSDDEGAAPAAEEFVVEGPPPVVNLVDDVFVGDVRPSAADMHTRHTGPIA